ncbi:hypothetical protein J6Z48_00640 [bacterium]|nr:hypothetical protein [bacterium]
MRNKKKVIICICDAFLTLFLIAVGLFAYHLYKEKQIVNDKVLLLNGQVEELKKTNSEQESAIEEMEDTIREMSVSIRGVENSNYNQEYKNHRLENTVTKLVGLPVSFSEEEIKTALQNYLDLQTAIKEGKYLDWLGFKDYLGNNVECYKSLIDQSLVHRTKLLYTEVFTGLRDYMSEELVWDYVGNHLLGSYSVSKDGYFCYMTDSYISVHNSYRVKKVIVKDSSSGLYIADVTEVGSADGDSSAVFNVEFKIEDYKGKSVISYINWLN